MQNIYSVRTGEGCTFKEEKQNRMRNIGSFYFKIRKINYYFLYSYLSGKHTVNNSDRRFTIVLLLYIMVSSRPTSETG